MSLAKNLDVKVRVKEYLFFLVCGSVNFLLKNCLLFCENLEVFENFFREFG